MEKLMQKVTIKAVEVTSSNRDKKAVVTAAIQTASSKAITRELLIIINFEQTYSPLLLQ